VALVGGLCGLGGGGHMTLLHIIPHRHWLSSGPTYTIFLCTAQTNTTVHSVGWMGLPVKWLLCPAQFLTKKNCECRFTKIYVLKYRDLNFCSRIPSLGSTVRLSLRSTVVGFGGCQCDSQEASAILCSTMSHYRRRHQSLSR
jgi:hypothetical protein